MSRSSKLTILSIAAAILLISSACQALAPDSTAEPAQSAASDNSAAQPVETEATAAPQPTRTAQPTRTPRPQTPTADYDMTATAEVAPKMKILQDLYDQGLVSTTDAAYSSLEDFDESWAQLMWYQWWQTGYSPTNFVIQADASWSSASPIANWPDSGCGFVYHESDENNHHRTYLAMDGRVYSDRFVNGVYTPLKGGYYGKLKTPSDSAKIMMIVENHTVTFLVNGQKVVSFEDPKLEGGNLALTLASGTNKDYDTNCQMKNIDLWELPETAY